MRALFVAVGLTALAGHAQPRDATARCREACERHLKEPRARATACGACVLSPGSPAAWVARLPEAPPALLSDPEWEVRWAGLLAQARARTKAAGARHGGAAATLARPGDPVAQHTAVTQLAAWLERARGEERVRACSTALHAAGQLGRPLAELLPAPKGKPGPCAEVLPAVVAQARPDLASIDPQLRRETLVHLSTALSLSPARVTLDALATRDPAFDALGVETLESWTREHSRAAAAELREAATPADAAAMNRALAVLAAQRDRLRPLLAARDEATRREGVSGLAQLAPLSHDDLLDALGDEAPALRLLAARGLSWGERRPLGAMVAARLSGERPATPAQQEVLLELLVDTSDPECATVALAAARSLSPIAPRALAAAAACDWSTAQADVEQALTSPLEPRRAAALRALGSAPASPERGAQLTAALADPSAAVREGACAALGAPKWKRLAPQLAPLAKDPVALVRRTALASLAIVEAPGAEGALLTALARDTDAAVRAAAARALVRFQGPRVQSALVAAARQDPDPHVKLVAGESLRKLGAGSAPTP